MEKLDPVLMDFLLKLILAVISIGWSACLVYHFGIKQYFRQRKHEQAVKRYLENGLDVIAANIDHALSVFRRNFVISRRVLRLFRENQKHGIKVPLENYLPKFERYDKETFCLTPFYKLRTLLGKEGEIFWEASQEMFAFLDCTTDMFFQDDLSVAIREHEGGKSKVSADELADIYEDEINKYYSEFDKFYIILAEIQNIIAVFEELAVSLEGIKNFKNHPEVKACVERMREKFRYLEEKKICHHEFNNEAQHIG